MNKKNKKRILLVMPRFPYPSTGACEQDRASGIELFIKLGYEVRVIAKVTEREVKEVSKVSKRLGIDIFPVSYTFTREESSYLKWWRIFVRIINPLFWDGASYEYRDKKIREVFVRELDEFKPDVVWVEYTNLWPLYKYAKKRNIPIITRSINFEPTHFIQEDGFSFLNVFKFVSKLFGEMITIRNSDFLFAITPKEEKLYKKFGAKKIMTLPLRGLFGFLDYRALVLYKDKLNIFFMGSTYNVSHNKKALEMVISKIAPLAEKKFPNKFTFHILGAKFPENLRGYCKDSVLCHGYVDDIESFMKDMDVALIPSLFGAGMQQKIFEPMARGIPTVSSGRGLADYPFRNKEHLYTADTPEEFVDALIILQDKTIRQKLSKNSKELSQKLFSEEAIENIINQSLKEVLIKTK